MVKSEMEIRIAPCLNYVGIYIFYNMILVVPVLQAEPVDTITLCFCKKSCNFMPHIPSAAPLVILKKEQFIVFLIENIGCEKTTANIFLLFCFFSNFYIEGNPSYQLYIDFVYLDVLLISHNI